MEETFSLPEDETFTIQLSGNMELRNQLRSGLVEAQQKDTGKVPLYVSWPEWLEDGIVCLYVKDFKEIVSGAIRETARAVMTGENADEALDEAVSVVESAGEQEFSGLDLEGLEHVQQDSPPAPPENQSGTTGLEGADIPEGLL